MKIGILTLPLRTNYGGILQAYALQMSLRDMGHEVYIIEKKRKPLYLPIWKAPAVYGKRLIKNVLGTPVPIFYEQKKNRENNIGLPIIRQNTDKFIEKYINRYIVDDFSAIREKDFDSIIVGSDQIWRPKYFPEIQHAFLDFTGNWGIKRIAYAASFGTDEWEYSLKQTKSCSNLLKKFDAVSVREDSGVTLCSEHLGVEARHLLDPTMLLDTADYMDLCSAAGVAHSPGTLLCYILDESPEKMALIEKMAVEKGLVPFRVNSKVENRQAPLEERIQPPVEQWLRGFYDAEFVITDSFHACVFSILFNKPFIAIGNKDRGMSRFTSLLKMFDLQDRLISLDMKNNIKDNIDWVQVNSILTSKRLLSRQFLENSLI